MFHLPSLKSHPGADVVAICGRNRERAAEIAGKYDIPQVFTDYRKMIAEGGLDATLIASPDDLHYEMALKAKLNLIYLSIVTNQAERVTEQRFALFGDQETLEAKVPTYGSATGGAVLRGVRKGEETFTNLPLSTTPEEDALFHQPLIAYGLTTSRRKRSATGCSLTPCSPARK